MVWRACADRLLERVRRFGADVATPANETYVNLLRRKKKFGILQPSSGERFDIGIKRKGVRAVGRFEDGVTKILKVSYVLQATAQLGLSADLIPGLGTLLLLCTALYVMPPTAALGAVLLTGYLGGAVVVNLRVGHSAFETLFPTMVGGLAWAGLFLRDARLRVLIPWRKSD